MYRIIFTALAAATLLSGCQTYQSQNMTRARQNEDMLIQQTKNIRETSSTIYQEGLRHVIRDIVHRFKGGRVDIKHGYPGRAISPGDGFKIVYQIAETDGRQFGVCKNKPHLSVGEDLSHFVLPG